MLLPPASDPVLDPPVDAFYWAGLRKPWLQVFAVFLVTTFFAWASRSWSPGPWNLLGMVGVPISIAFIANRDVARLFFALVLTFISFASLIVNEVAAHLLFATCLYD